MDGYVYGVIHPRHPGHVKIGKALDPHKRLVSYNTGDPKRQYHLIWVLKVDDYAAAERKAHRLLDGYRVTGTEWFRMHFIDAYFLIRDKLKGDA